MIIIGRRKEIRKKTARAAAYHVTPIRLFLKDTFFMQTLLHLCWHEVHLFEYVTLILYINIPESKPVNSFINVR